MSSGDFDESAIVGGYKPDHLYNFPFKNGAGTYFTVVTLEDGTQSIEYEQPFPSRNRIKVTVSFIKDRNDIKDVVLKKFKQYKDGWREQEWGPNEPLTLSYFSFQKLAGFLQLLTELDLPNIGERRISLRGDEALGISDDAAKTLRSILIQPDGQRIVEELVAGGLITSHDLVNIGYRRRQLEIFRRLLDDATYAEQYRLEHVIQSQQPEKVWQHFFSTNPWIFGFGLDYRFMGILQDEAHIGQEDIAGRDGAIVDYLLGCTNFTVLVEIKRPETPLFEERRNRANAWRLSRDLTDALSQILEQKAAWQIRSEVSAAQNFADDSSLITQRTLDPKCILIVAADIQFGGTEKERNMKRRTFELFRRDSRNVEIVTFDELYERAQFVVEGSPKRK